MRLLKRIDSPAIFSGEATRIATELHIWGIEWSRGAAYWCRPRAVIVTRGDTTSRHSLPLNPLFPLRWLVSVVAIALTTGLPARFAEKREVAMTPEQSSSSSDRLDMLLRRMLSKASVKAVYGEPITRDERVIVPISEVFVGIGFGFGGGTTSASNEVPEQQGDGGGAGGSTMARPVGVVIIEPSGVHVEPVVDVTKLGLALFTTIAAIGIGWFRLQRAYAKAEQHSRIVS